jgi:hypothetical protein
LTLKQNAVSNYSNYQVIGTKNPDHLMNRTLFGSSTVGHRIPNRPVFKWSFFGHFFCPIFKWSGPDLFVRFSNGRNKMAAKKREFWMPNFQ